MLWTNVTIYIYPKTQTQTPTHPYVHTYTQGNAVAQWLEHCIPNQQGVGLNLTHTCVCGMYPYGHMSLPLYVQGLTSVEDKQS